MTERWKIIKDFPGYKVSDQGRVKRLERRTKTARGIRLCPEMFLSGTLYKGYPRVLMSDKDGKQKARFIHRLVLQTFEGPAPAGHIARHKDGNPGNPKLKNLKWGTVTQNQHDRRKHGTIGFKLTPDKVRQIRKLFLNHSNQEIGAKFGVTSAIIWRIRTGKIWSWVT